NCPSVAGHRLEQLLELLTPATVQMPDQPHGYSIRVSLYTDNRQDDYAFIDWNGITKDPEHATVPGHVPLLTHSKTRSVLASIGNEPVASQFIELRIPPAPRKEDEAWSDWIFSTQRADLGPVSEPERMAIRYRVRPASESYCNGEVYPSNLRFYVRRQSVDTWRRGVVFVRELVPRRAIALVARAFYGERYVALPMKHNIEHVDGTLSVEYSWRRGKKWEFLKMSAPDEPQSIPAGSHAEFITEHYWGYTCVRDGCSEYRVEHPRWKIWNAARFEFSADVTALYGEQFA